MNEDDFGCFALLILAAIFLFAVGVCIGEVIAKLIKALS